MLAKVRTPKLEAYQDTSSQPAARVVLAVTYVLPETTLVWSSAIFVLLGAQNSECEGICLHDFLHVCTKRFFPIRHMTQLSGIIFISDDYYSLMHCSTLGLTTTRVCSGLDWKRAPTCHTAPSSGSQR